MEQDSQPEAYLLHVWFREIHPMLWRRFLVRSDCTVADLHFVLQIGFEWTDFHLHRFRLRKKDYAVPRLGGLAGAHDAREVKLADLHFRLNERFLYEYDFNDLWQLQVRIEERSAIEAKRPYSVCVGGGWAGPPEDCGGPKAFLERRAGASRNCSTGCGKASTRTTSKRFMTASRGCSLGKSGSFCIASIGGR